MSNGIYLQELRQAKLLPPAAPKRQRTPSTRVIAATDHYRRELATNEALEAICGKISRWGVLRAVCRQYGGKPSAVCMRMKREAEAATP